ncbi:uncharacterized protein LOC103828087 isoform X2 [Brassica rapa]|uniref:uncharacterized protein LOC103828087 isoform X2 n=1 Tax=Brassica campestris TaxID=3711 RepID=UPI00142E619B|nr:uncharacterized protein LOC103828087 isoform X2 [Brassica rapa]
MANPKSVDPSLWWDSFGSLLSSLENASLSHELPQPIGEKLEENHAWFVNTLSMFKPPSVKSKDALDSDLVQIKQHRLVIKPHLKLKALRISSHLNLDEIQSYILVERCTDQEYGSTDSLSQHLLDMILLQYYIERQCLLKCTKRILTHALYTSREQSTIRDAAVKLISDGLEKQQSSLLENLFSSSFPQHMDVNLFTLWAEETLIEDNLVLDILFLLYHESFHTCNGERWRTLCSLYKGILLGSYSFWKLAVSAEAQHSACRVKIQLLMILIDTLDMENLLQMVHDGLPFRSGPCVFSIIDVQEMDATISSLNTLEVKEAGPLVLAWAVFLCLISSLPGKEEIPFLMEIDHVSYVHQAFEAASLSYFLDVLQSNVLNDFDGPISGFRSVLRTFISAFIASYEINIQLEDANLELILEILCKVYQGEESLCSQFWDRKSSVDGPIRCLLFDLESEFPFRSVEFIRLLSSLSEGSWPAECVYNFLDKSVGISTLFDITSDSVVDGASQLVETSQPLQIPGLEGLVIPRNTRGRILRVINENTGLVRWEYSLSGATLLIIHLANVLYTGNNREAFVILELVRRMVTFNKAVCFSLLNISHFFHVNESYMNEKLESDVRVVDIICNSVRSLTFDSSGVAMMAMAIDILAKLLRCSPSNVAPMVLKANIFDMTSGPGVPDSGFNISLSGSWSLSGKLAKMILIDCEKNDTSCPLVISVLEFTMQLVEGGVENDLVLALIVFSLQYVLVSHESWKYNHGHMRWNVTLKVIEVMKTCLRFSKFSAKLKDVLLDILLNDASVHNALFRIICTTAHTLENLRVHRFIEPAEIEGWQLSIVSVLDVLDITLSQSSQSTDSGLPVFHQTMLSSTSKPIPVVAAITSLISYFRNPTIQICAAKVLSKLYAMAESSQLYIISKAGFGLDDKQVRITSLCYFVHLLCAQPAFSELLAQYSKLGYSGGKELMPMILSDLNCHLQGKLEGRDIPTGPFKELFQFLVESGFWEKYKQSTDIDKNMALGDNILFDIQHIRTELGTAIWDFSEWKTSKATTEEMLSYMQRANSMVLISTSQVSALHALTSVLILYEDNSLEDSVAVERKVPARVTLSSIDEVCKKFSSRVDSLASLWDAPKIVFDILTAQADLLSSLLKSGKKNLPSSVCALVLRNVGPGLKILGSLRHSNAILKKTVNLLLEVLLLVVGSGSDSSNSSEMGHMAARDLAEISDATIGLLPLLCNFMGNPEYLTLCLTTVDLILRNFLTPETWFPIIQSHLRLQHVILQLQDKKSSASVSAIMKFFLTIAQVHDGAQMLLNSGFFSTLRALFIDLPDGISTLVSDDEKGGQLDKKEKPQHMWGLGLAVVTAMVNSLGSVSVGADIVESVISYFFSEKGYMISYYLSAPDFPSDDREKVRARTQRTWTSLAYLRETEHTLLLMCALASHWRSWVKIMKEMDSPLREMAIHLLAFISKGAQRLRESHIITSHLLCPPVVKEEFDSCKRQSVINSKHGWFALVPLVCVGKPKLGAVSISTALVVRGQTTEQPGSVPQSHFTDSVAVQIYRVASLLLNFLCLQAEGVVKRAEEVGYVDLAHFPELPEPEILHGLQDQATAIVAELCDNYKEVPNEVKKLCLLLLQITEKSLYLELCVVQVCRIHQVFGRVDNFSKDFKKLVKAAEAHAYLEPSMDSLKKIAVFLYPGLL